MASGGNDFVVNTTGLLELQAKVLELSSRETMWEVSTPVYRECVKRARREMIYRAPRSEVPRGPRKKPSLKSKQEWRDGKHAIDKMEIEPISFKEDGDMTQWVGISTNDTSSSFYLKFHEYGTSKMPARPFARPTAHIMKPVFVSEMTEALRKKLEELEE